MMERYRKGTLMSRGTHWFAGAVLAALLSVSPALAAGDTRAADVDWTAVRPSPTVAAALQAPASGMETPSLELRPVQIAYSPTYGLSSSTLLSAGNQAVGFQAKRANANRHVQWAIYGAAIGLVIGLIDDDPVQNALIGGAIGFGLSYVISR
jgi:hypothetical protein